MLTIENVLTAYNPIIKERVYSYAIFFVASKVTFSARDLQLLFDQWRATLTLPNPYQEHFASIPPLVGTYNQEWLGEREKFFALFKQYSDLELEGKHASISLIYPEIQEEVTWKPAQALAVPSTRGLQLVNALSTLQHNGQLGLAVAVQYAYNDPVSNTSTLARGLTYDNTSLSSAIERSVLDPEHLFRITRLNVALPLFVLDDMWRLFRNTNPHLLSKYGIGEAPSAGLAAYRGLFDNRDTGFRTSFDRFAELDVTTQDDKLLMLDFIHGNGEQYAICRHRGAFEFIMLAPSVGSKMLSSKVEKDVRGIVRAIYVEQ